MRMGGGQPHGETDGWLLGPRRARVHAADAALGQGPATPPHTRIPQPNLRVLLAALAQQQQLLEKSFHLQTEAAAQDKLLAQSCSDHLAPDPLANAGSQGSLAAGR